jgi:hypothetical protein
MMTRQEIFDKVAKHLLTQNSKAVDADSRCQYKMPDGRRCAIGCLIPDELYDPEMEGELLRDLLKKFPVLQTLWSDADRYFVCSLQMVHDIYPVAHWVDVLRFIANQFELKYEHILPGPQSSESCSVPVQQAHH